MSLDSVPRRQVLAAVSSISTLALVGCSLLENEEPPPKLVVRNFSNETGTVSLTVRNAESGEVVIDEDVTLKPDENHPYEQPFTTSGEKSLTASLKDGETREYTWGASTEPSVTVVGVIISSDGDLLITRSTA